MVISYPSHSASSFFQSSQGLRCTIGVCFTEYTDTNGCAESITVPLSFMFLLSLFFHGDRKPEINSIISQNSSKVEQVYHEAIYVSSCKRRRYKGDNMSDKIGRKETGMLLEAPPSKESYNSRRPSRARLSVPSSAYSRSLPRGRPRARVVTRNCGTFSSFLILSLITPAV